jgi:ketosteroid isomerase-like protein
MPVKERDQVLRAAERRAQALAARDATALHDLMHESLTWTTFRGEVLDRDGYIAGNTEGQLVWQSQLLEDAEVVVIGNTAVLTARDIDTVRRDTHDEESYTLRLTQTWVRTDDKWQCLAGHAGPRI